MGRSVPEPQRSIEVPSMDRDGRLDGLRPTPAKVETPASPSRSIATGRVVKDALIRHYGSLKAAAISMAYDQPQLSRDLDRGTFHLAKLDRCDDDAKAFVAGALREAFGDGDPKVRRQRLVRDLRHIADELAEVI